MARHNHGSPVGAYEDQGVHHHYHYYGDAAGAAPPPQGAFAGNAAGAPGAANPANLHRHPGADSLVKGIVVGAGVAYLLTNERAQRTVLRTAVHLWKTLQGGVEEWKERLRDAEAEAEAAAVPTKAPSPPEGGTAAG